MLQEIAEFASAVGALATAVGIFYARSTLQASLKQAMTNFEDSLNREYRDLARHLPVSALLGQELSVSEVEKNLALFYHYFDLSNEQAFLRQQRRVSDSTWTNWADGIATNLRKPAFRSAWILIKNPSSFHELRWLESRNFIRDPAGVSLDTMNLELSAAASVSPVNPLTP